MCARIRAELRDDSDCLLQGCAGAHEHIQASTSKWLRGCVFRATSRAASQFFFALNFRPCPRRCAASRLHFLARAQLPQLLQCRQALRAQGARRQAAEHAARRAEALRLMPEAAGSAASQVADAEETTVVATLFTALAVLVSVLLGRHVTQKCGVRARHVVDCYHTC
jgi:hypothetical protein